MPKVHLFHGFNVFDGGKGSIDRLIPHFEELGYEVIQHDYGWVGLFRLRCVNQKTVQKALRSVSKGDILVGHSNGCLICWKLLEAGCGASQVVCIQPALRRDTPWRDTAQVLCLYNPNDWVVSLGRVWGRFISVTNPFKNRHGWGSAGRHGFNFQPHVFNVDTSKGFFPAEGHSGIFKYPHIIKYWFDEAIKKFLNNNITSNKG